MFARIVLMVILAFEGRRRNQQTGQSKSTNRILKLRHRVWAKQVVMRVCVPDGVFFRPSIELGNHDSGVLGPRDSSNVP